MRAEGIEAVRRILCVFPRYTSSFGTFEHAYPLTDGVQAFMPPQGLLLIAAYLPGRIKRLVRHPMLLAVILWSVSHLLSIGTLNDVLLFGGFLLWAVADLVSVSRRAYVRPVPGSPATAANDVIVVVVGLGFYFMMLLWAHAHVIGVSPLG